MAVVSSRFIMLKQVLQENSGASADNAKDILTYIEALETLHYRRNDDDNLLADLIESAHIACY